MSGRILMGGLLAFAAVFAIVLWYFQTRAFYVIEEAVPFVMVADQEIPVTAYEGINASTSPIKERACFQVDSAQLLNLSGIEPANKAATPLTAPDWFACFDAEMLADDIKSGLATAYLAEREAGDGVDRYVAFYQDGRGFMWRQLNDKYAH